MTITNTEAITSTTITKLRYITDLSTIEKVKHLDSGRLIGKGWNTRPAENASIKPGEPYFVRTGDDHLVVIDFDMPNQHDKIDVMLGARGLPIHGYRTRTVSGGEHYYARVKQCGRPVSAEPFFQGLKCFYGNKNRGGGESNRAGLPDIRGDSPGFVFGVTTRFKNGGYEPIDGTEETIPWVDGWRVKWISGELGKVAGIDLGVFLDGKIDLKAPGVLKKPETAWTVWINAMLELKKWGYTPDEVDEALSKVPGYDVAAMKHDISQYWNAPEKVRIQASESGAVGSAALSALRAANALAAGAWEVAIDVEPGKATEARYILRDDGVFYETTVYKKDKATGVDTPVSTLTRVWRFNGFEIETLMKEEDENGVGYRINGKFDGDTYRDKSIDELNSILYTKCGIGNRHKQVFNPLVREYAKVNNTPVVPYARVAGFTEKGWRLPDKYYIKFTEAQVSARAPFSAMAAMQIDTRAAVEHFKALYDATSVKGKDIAFAYGCVAVFLNALKKHTDLQPFLAFYSPGGGTGKSWLSNVITCKFWNNIPEDDIAVTKDQFNSPSRAQEYLAFSTCPVPIDDCQDLRDDITTILKTHLAGQSHFTRKNVRQGLAVDKSNCASVVMNYNTRPAMFHDLALLQRGVEMFVDARTTDDEQDKFRKAYDLGPRGEFGKFIYEMTKDWVLDDIIEWYEKTPRWPGAPGTRANVIYRVFKFGAMLCKHWTGIDLDVEGVKDLVLGTLGIVSHDWFGTIQMQITDGQRKDVLVFRSKEGDQYENKFHPDNKWIQHEVVTCVHHEVEGWLYQAINLRDLVRGLNIKVDVDLVKLHAVMAGLWPGVELCEQKSVKIDDNWHNLRGIFIPKAVFLEQKSSPVQQKLGVNVPRMTTPVVDLGIPTITIRDNDIEKCIVMDLVAAGKQVHPEMLCPRDDWRLDLGTTRNLLREMAAEGMLRLVPGKGNDDTYEGA